MDNVLGTRPPVHLEMDTNTEKEKHIKLLYEQSLELYKRVGTPEGLENLKKDLNIEGMDWDSMTPEQQEELVEDIMEKLPISETTEDSIDTLFPDSSDSNT